MVAAVVVAAGRSTRMGGGDKNMLDIAGKPALRRCLEAFDESPDIDHICLVTAADRLEACGAAVRQWGIGKLKGIVCGGETRSASVYNGLLALPEGCEIVAIQDGARPFATAEIIRESVRSAVERGSGVAAIPCRDTVKVAAADGRVQATPDRSTLWLVQTPQTFRYDLIKEAYEHALRAGAEATDDAAMLELIGRPVFLTQGHPDNIKLTTPEDIRHGEAIVRAREDGGSGMRIGEGFDVHKLVEGRALILGGVEIPHEKGLLGHSDADVLVHAIMDALLGAAALGDIGKHFPDSDTAYKGISSLKLLKHVADLLARHGYSVGNVDATVAAQRPKLATYIPQMRQNIADCLGVSAEQVSVKATTTERLGYEGREEGMSARAVALIEKI